MDKTKPDAPTPGRETESTSDIIPQERHLRIAASIALDASISSDAKVAYLVLQNANFTGRVAISYGKIAERMGVSRDTARRAVGQLLARSYVSLDVAECVNGKAPVFNLTHSKNAQGVASTPIAESGTPHSKNTEGTHSKNSPLTTSSPLVSISKNDVVGADSNGTKEDDIFEDVVVALGRNGFDDVSARSEAKSIVRAVGPEAAINAAAWLLHLRGQIGVQNPVALAISKARDGARPPCPRSRDQDLTLERDPAPAREPDPTPQPPSLEARWSRVLNLLYAYPREREALKGAAISEAGGGTALSIVTAYEADYRQLSGSSALRFAVGDVFGPSISLHVVSEGITDE